MEGIITTIQRMSVHDGPGIRSTLFLKGCNLRCRWCHNPETWSRQVQLQQTPARCIGCGSCLAACSFDALSAGSDRVRIDRERCTVCGACVEACPSGALTLVGERITVEEAFRRIARDLPFYRQTGGGVTASGGEPLLQPLFLKELLIRCRQENIHTAVETNLAVDREVVRMLMPHVDEWMCDCKLLDSDRHREVTGLGNEAVLANLAFLIGQGARVTVRMPVVPGVNDSEREIGAICRWLVPFASRLKGYELLPFHTLGFDKFDACGIENPMAGARPLEAARFDRLRTYARSILSITR